MHVKSPLAIDSDLVSRGPRVRYDLCNMGCMDPGRIQKSTIATIQLEALPSGHPPA